MPTEKYIHYMKMRRFVFLSLFFGIIFIASFQGDIHSLPTNQLKSFQIIEKDYLEDRVGTKVYYNYYTNAFAEATQEIHSELTTPMFIPGIDMNQEWSLIDPFQPLYDQVYISDSDSPPYTFIGHLYASWDTDLDGIADGFHYCTGFLEGPDILVTAGHCVYNTKEGGWAMLLTYIPSEKVGDYSYIPAVVDIIYLSQEFYFNESADEDWAVLKLNTRVGLETGWLGKGWSPGSMNGKEVATAGYPSERTYVDIWVTRGEIVSTLTTRIKYSLETEMGESGSPIYDTSGIVWGIHTRGSTFPGGFSSGTKMTESLYNVIHLEYLYSILDSD